MLNAAACSLSFASCDARLLLQEEHFDSVEFAELEKMRDVVEMEKRIFGQRLRRIDEHNRIFFEKAAHQIDSSADSRKILKLVSFCSALKHDPARPIGRRDPQSTTARRCAA
jgi:hypothetical protein